MMKVCDCVSHLTWISIRFHGDESDDLGSSCMNQAYDFTEDLFYVATSAIALVVVLVVAYNDKRAAAGLSRRVL